MKFNDQGGLDVVKLCEYVFRKAEEENIRVVQVRVPEGTPDDVTDSIALDGLADQLDVIGQLGEFEDWYVEECFESTEEVPTCG
jgi:hypothetical protein